MQKFYIISCLFLMQISAAQAQKADAESNKYMGVASCSSSNCHGAVSPRNSSNVLQNEYVTWHKQDKHSQSYTNLLNADSKKIAQNLGIAAAEKEDLCLSCHSTYNGLNPIPNNQKSEKFTYEDGISCERCHGAASNWLSSHSASKTTHQDNLKNGLNDLVNLEKRAQLCSQCHFGNDTQYVSHKLIGAGHPRLSFELDTFSAISPAHWLVDQDYEKRKAAYNPSQAWITGQYYLARASLDLFSSAKRQEYAGFPELTQYYCYNCHHSLSEKQWKERDYHAQPGKIKLNLSFLSMLNIIANSLGDHDLDANLEKLSQQTNIAEISLEIKKQIEDKKDLFLSTKLDPAKINSMLINLLEYANQNKFLPYEIAEQIAMGTSALVASTNNSKDKDKNTDLHQAQINKIYKTLANANDFKPQDFSAACADFLKQLS